MNAYCIACGTKISMTLDEVLQDEIEYRKMLSLESDNWQGVVCETCRYKYETI